MSKLIAVKSYDFSLHIISLYKDLSTKREFILSKQLLRSGTAIGALIREAEYAQSKKDFIHKLSISLKEANESKYWIDLLKDSGFIVLDTYCQLSSKIDELLRMLISIIKTAKRNLGIE